MRKKVDFWVLQSLYIIANQTQKLNNNVFTVFTRKGAYINSAHKKQWSKRISSETISDFTGQIK